MCRQRNNRDAPSRTNQQPSRMAVECGWQCGCCVPMPKRSTLLISGQLCPFDLQLVLASQLDNNLYFARCAHLNVFTYCLCSLKTFQSPIPIPSLSLYRSQFMHFFGSFSPSLYVAVSVFNHLKMYTTFLSTRACQNVNALAKGLTSSNAHAARQFVANFITVTNRSKSK